MTPINQAATAASNIHMNHTRINARVSYDVTSRTVELGKELVGCNVLLRHGATNTCTNIDTSVHMCPHHLPHYKTWYACEAQAAALCRAIKGDVYSLSPHLTS